MASSKPKTKKTSNKLTTAKKPKETKAKEMAPKKIETTEKVEIAETVTAKKPAKICWLKGLFEKKFDPEENILTFFKNPRSYAGILGEILGTMMLTILLLMLGINPLFVFFSLLVITVGVYGLSGAQLNPIVTAGMMATRRISLIRGVVYLLSQLVGAWFGLLVVNGFRLAAESITKGEIPLASMTPFVKEHFLALVAVEILGAIIIGFFFARALAYKRSAFTFASVVAGGFMFAIFLGLLITGNYFRVQNVFMMNPAVALMYQILPTSGADFMKLLSDIVLALSAYVLLPMTGGVIGFYLADISAKLAGEDLK